MTLPTGDARTVGPRIRMMMPHLTPLESRVVERILRAAISATGTSLKTVADDAGVSEAMIVKIAKKLGFDGFKDFRAGLVDYNRLPTADLHEELSPDDSDAEIARKVFRTSVHALEETLVDPRPARLRTGGGHDLPRPPARFLRHRRFRPDRPRRRAQVPAHRRATSVFDDAHMMLMSAALLGEGDVAIAFSHSGSTTAVLEAVGAGAPTRRANDCADQLFDFAARLDRRRGSLLDGTGLAAAGRECRGAHRPADHIRRRLRRRGAPRPCRRPSEISPPRWAPSTSKRRSA